MRERFCLKSEIRYVVEWRQSHLSLLVANGGLFYTSAGSFLATYLLLLFPVCEDISAVVESGFHAPSIFSVDVEVCQCIWLVVYRLTTSHIQTSKLEKDASDVFGFVHVFCVDADQT